jgi:hypothetical protein
MEVFAMTESGTLAAESQEDVTESGTLAAESQDDTTSKSTGAGVVAMAWGKLKGGVTRLRGAIFGAPDPDKSKNKKVKESVTGLLGFIFSDTSDTMAQDKADKVLKLRSSALGKDGADAEASLLQLEAMDRATEIPSLNKAAASLAGITVLLTGLFTGIGFSTGDFIRMIRDFQGVGIAFLILASTALILGTFAFVINGCRSTLNLWSERIAVYLGIACAAVAFILAAWGIAQGASAGATRPTISASFDTTSGTPVLKVSVSSSDVPRSEHLTATVWGKRGGGWVVLGNLITGPTRDGANNANITVNNIMPYSTIVVNALLSAKDISLAPAPRNGCSTGMSCFQIAGFGTPSPLSTTPSK